VHEASNLVEARTRVSLQSVCTYMHAQLRTSHMHITVVDQALLDSTRLKYAPCGEWEYFSCVRNNLQNYMQP
jgi:hypothetical protein